METKKFIDIDTEDIISQLSQDETGKRQYYRPVYSLHKWWARRPGALFRSIILATQDLNNVLFTHSLDNSISDTSEYFKDHDLSQVVILDPFMGGGTTLVEANRMGAKIIGSDLNPVAFWVVKETLKNINLDKLDKYFHQLELAAGAKIRNLYGTKCVQCDSSCDSLYSFWIRHINCISCGENVYLYKRTLLNEGESRNKPVSVDNPATAFCPNCLNINSWNALGDCTCSHCDYIFNPQEGIYDQGYYTCTKCKARHQLIDTLEAGQQFKEKLVAIEYLCNSCNKRLYKAPDKMDLEKINSLENTFSDLKEDLIYPRQKILEGDSSVRWRLHKFEHYYQIFNPRQLLAFNYLFDGIWTIPEQEYRDAFITIFSNSLEYNNMMTPYNYPHRKLHHLFNYHALPLTTTPVENSVWGVGNEGAGTFVNCYRRYVQAKKYCLSPFDKYKTATGDVHTVQAKKEKIGAQFVSSFDDLGKVDRGAFLLCGDSSVMPSIPDQSVDFVITDPPYYDNLSYSELSNFFYVWLNCLISDPHLGAENVPTQKEAIVNGGMDKGENEYQGLLMAVFKECERVLKNEGKLIFTFHHTKLLAWWTVLSAIVGSGFRVIDSFPVSSEYKVNPHIRDKQSLDMDLVLICQKKGTSATGKLPSIEDILGKAMAQTNGKSGPTNSKLFLHFMGELLKAASSIDTTKISYIWFENALVHLDDYLTMNQKVPDRPYKYETSQRSQSQLRLLERKP